MEENKEINQELKKETNQEIKKVILSDMEIAENSENAIKKDEEENERKRKILKRLHFFMMFLLSGVIAGTGSFLYGHSA